MGILATLGQHVREGGRVGRLGLVVAGVLVALMSVLLTLLSTGIETYRAEQEGAHGVEALYRLINGLQRHRDLSAAVLAGAGGRDSERMAQATTLTALLARKADTWPGALQQSEKWTASLADWRDIDADGSEWTATENYRRHTELVSRLLAFVVDVADHSRLTLDSHLDTYYLQDMLVNKLPGVQENLSRLRALGVFALTRQTLRAEIREQIRITLNDLAIARRLHDQTMARLSNILPEQTEGLAQAQERLQRGLVEVTQLLESDILGDRFATAPGDYFTLVSAQIEVGHQLARDIYQPQLSQRLAQRIDQARRWMIIVSLGVLIAVASLGYIILQVIVRARALARANAELAGENARRRQTELELREAIENVQLANRAKSEFLANLSHEVRTPLNGILGMADILSMSSLDEEQKPLLKEMTASGKHLNAMLERIIDFTHLEAGDIQLAATPFSLRELIESSLRQYLTVAMDKGLSLSLDWDDALPEVIVGDGRRLKQALDCLIDNAVKFTDAGAVVVSAGIAANAFDSPPAVGESSGARVVCLKVADTGPGVPAAQRKFIFQSFTQADGSITRRAGGNGLGLAIARRLAELMGGSLTVEARPGGGSVFALTARVNAFTDE